MDFTNTIFQKCKVEIGYERRILIMHKKLSALLILVLCLFTSCDELTNKKTVELAGIQFSYDENYKVETNMFGTQYIITLNEYSRMSIQIEENMPIVNSLEDKSIDRYFESLLSKYKNTYGNAYIAPNDTPVEVANLNTKTVRYRIGIVDGVGTSNDVTLFIVGDRVMTIHYMAVGGFYGEDMPLYMEIVDSIVVE